MATWRDNPGLLQSGQPLFGSGTSSLLGYTPKSIPHYIGPKALPDFSATAASVASSTATSPLAMPDVEGYKYAYVPWQWNSDAGDGSGAYEQLAFNVFDQTQYPYFPYMPTGGQVIRDGNRANRILVGFRLVPDDTDGSITIDDTTTTSATGDDTTTSATGDDTTTTDVTATDITSSGNPYEDYVNKYPDLLNAWNDIQAQRAPHYAYWYPRGANSLAGFGYAHWNESGRNEGRTL